MVFLVVIFKLGICAVVLGVSVLILIVAAISELASRSKEDDEPD